MLKKIIKFIHIFGYIGLAIIIVLMVIDSRSPDLISSNIERPILTMCVLLLFILGIVSLIKGIKKFFSSLKEYINSKNYLAGLGFVAITVIYIIFRMIKHGIININ